MKPPRKILVLTGSQEGLKPHPSSALKKHEWCAYMTVLFTNRFIQLKKVKKKEHIYGVLM